MLVYLLLVNHSLL